VTHLGLQFFFNFGHTHIIGCHTTDTLLQDNFTGKFFVLDTSQLLILYLNPGTTASLMENTEDGLLFLQPQNIRHRDSCCVLSMANPVSIFSQCSNFLLKSSKNGTHTLPLMTTKLHNTKCRIPLLSQQQISNRS